MSLPYLTSDFPGIGGVIKQRPEDFFVQEIPIYEPTGAGEHVFVEVQKVGITTFEAIGRISTVLGISPRDIGYAGLKDSYAVTRQVFSILGTTPEKVQALQIDGLTIQWVDKHINKLRLGHLKGNRFVVKIRDVNATDVVKLEPVLDQFRQTGLPNYFGEQRFGKRGNNHLLGAAIIRQDDQALIELLLGKPDPAVDDAQIQGARKAFDQNDLRRAMRLWPRNAGIERRVLHRLMKTGKPKQAARAVDQRLIRLWVSAIQSNLFNQVVAKRVERGILSKLLDGDFAIKHENGAGFLVEEAAKEQPRCDAFEISPTAPLVGYRVTLPQGEPLKLEQEIFAAAGLSPADFKKEGGERAKGTRRAVRIRPEEVELAGGGDEHGPFISVSFTLPAGSFATVLLGELMKSERHQKPEDEEEGDGESD